MSVAVGRAVSGGPWLSCCIHGGGPLNVKTRNLSGSYMSSPPLLQPTPRRFKRLNYLLLLTQFKSFIFFFNKFRSLTSFQNYTYLLQFVFMFLLGYPTFLNYLFALLITPLFYFLMLSYISFLFSIIHSSIFSHTNSII